MIYKATLEKPLFLYLLGMNGLFVGLGLGHVIFTSLLALFCVVALFVRYEFEIEDHILRYRMKIFSFLLYQKQVNSQDVEAIHFKRTHWTTRLAVVKYQGGFNLRIMRFAPLDVFEHLVFFAESNHIEITKTKDYKILEKMARQ